MSILMVTPAASNNAMGRAYSLSLLLDALALPYEVLSPRGDAGLLWEPLRKTRFAERCILVKEDSLAARLRDLSPLYQTALVVKPLPATLGAVLRHGRCFDKVVVDIDDPDLEAAHFWRPAPERLAVNLRHPGRAAEYRLCRAAAKRLPHFVSNPELLRLYEGTLLPHVRRDPGPGARHERREPVVAFVGTPGAHKGLDRLRLATAALAPRGYTLLVTADPPADARPWERWVGRTTLEEGLELVARSDIVALPSGPERYGRAQLPVKLVDAMLAARAVVASDASPLVWALGGTGVHVPSHDVGALIRALEFFADPSLRACQGQAARTRALSMFTVEANVHAFDRVMR